MIARSTAERSERRPGRHAVAGLRRSPDRGYAPGMLQTGHATKLKLTLPDHVGEVLTGWAVFELQKTPEEVLEALAEELCGNEQLRAFAARLMAD
jgi:hypothetical protein